MGFSPETSSNEIPWYILSSSVLASGAKLFFSQGLSLSASKALVVGFAKESWVSAWEAGFMELSLCDFGFTPSSLRQISKEESPAAQIEEGALLGGLMCRERSGIRFKEVKSPLSDIFKY